MALYTRATDFAAKDALLSGNPAKIIKGADIGAEFDALATAITAAGTCQAGSGDPGATAGAYSFWADTGNSLLKQRNAANTGWVTIAPLLTDLSTIVITSGSFTGTLTGGTTSPTVTVTWYRIGNFVQIGIPPVTFTSNTTSFTLTGGPSSLGNSVNYTNTRPSSPLLCMDNGAVATAAAAYVETNGLIRLVNGTLTGWTNSGAKGIGYSSIGIALTGTCFSYFIQ